jgi:DNA-binding NarL/FixJ family response regulator
MKLLVVDDHALFREGLGHVLRRLEDGVLIHEAGSCEEAFGLITSHDDFDLVLLDLALPGMGGFAGLETLREKFPRLPVVVLSGSEDARDMERVLRVGALGYIPKSSCSQVMLSALRLVFAGGVYLPPSMLQSGELSTPVVSKGVAKSSDGDKGTPDNGPLTARQREVLALLAEGKPNKLIARALNISEGTVKTHVATIFQVLNVNNRTEAVRAAQRLCLSEVTQG